MCLCSHPVKGNKVVRNNNPTKLQVVLFPPLAAQCLLLSLLLPPLLGSVFVEWATAGARQRWPGEVTLSRKKKKKKQGVELSRVVVCTRSTTPGAFAQLTAA